MADNQFYSSEEAEAILRIATRLQPGAIGRDQLSQNAAELGITAEALAAAEAEYAKSKVAAQQLAEEERLRHQFQDGRDIGWRTHLATYIAVNLLLTLIYFSTSRGDLFWPMFSMFGWGIGLLTHGIVHFSKSIRESEFQTWLHRRRGSELVRQFREQAPLPRPDRAQSADLLLDMLVESGVTDKLELIRYCREATNTSLVEAKIRVDDYEARRQQITS
jgi:hypothetical protein